jgi:hypothetical protein
MASTLGLLVAVALSAGGGSPDPLKWDGQSWRRTVDAQAKIAFPVPLTQTLIESRHFPEALATQSTDFLMLSGPQGFEVEIALFRRDSSVTLSKWIDVTLPFLRTAQHTELPWFAMKERVTAQLFELPRSGQQYAQREALFFIPGRVVRVTCRNVEDRRALAVFEAVLAGLEVLP